MMSGNKRYSVRNVQIAFADKDDMKRKQGAQARIDLLLKDGESNMLPVHIRVPAEGPQYLEYLSSLLKAVGVEKWERLTNWLARAIVDGDGKVIGLTHLRSNANVFNPIVGIQPSLFVWGSMYGHEPDGFVDNNATNVQIREPLLITHADLRTEVRLLLDTADGVKPFVIDFTANTSRYLSLAINRLLAIGGVTEFGSLKGRFVRLRLKDGVASLIHIMDDGADFESRQFFANVVTEENEARRALKLRIELGTEYAECCQLFEHGSYNEVVSRLWNVFGVLAALCHEDDRFWPAKVRPALADLLAKAYDKLNQPQKADAVRKSNGYPKQD
jgi:hypothetical protein